MKSKLVPYVLAALLVMMALSALPANAGQVNTFPGWNGTDTICCVGYPNSATYGEVVNSPGGNITSFSFFMQQAVGFQFQAYIGAWDNNNYLIPGGLSGVSYLSSVQTVTNGNLIEYTFSGLNVPTTAGAFYVLGITIDNVYNNDANFGAGTWGGTLFNNGNANAYFAWNNDSGNGSLLGSNWNNQGCANNGGTCGQAAFVINFGGGGTTPEPSSILFFGTGVLGIGAALRRKLF